MSNRPNILFITSDQQHPDGLGVVDARLQTPHLDRLRREGMLLTRSYTCAPLCTPARASWLSGQYPGKHGAWGVGTVLKEDCLSVASLLGEAGYRTAMIGKSHLQPGEGQHGQSKEGLPLRDDTPYFRAWHGPWYGCDHAEINVGHTSQRHSASMHYRAWLEDRGIDPSAYFGRQYPPVTAWDLPIEFHPAAWASERAIAYLDEHAVHHADTPFYLNLNFPEPHPPLHLQEPWFSMYADTPMAPPVRQWREWKNKPTIYRATLEGRQHNLGWHDQFRMANVNRSPGAMETGPDSAERYTSVEAECLRAYWGMISLMDAQIGRVLDRLDALGLADNTLVAFTSDHGDLMGDHFLIGKGACHYQGCVRVPTLLRWPGVIEAGAESPALISGVDWAPSFLAAAGLTPHPEMQGVNQAEVWCGRKATARDGVWINIRIEQGLYVNTWISERYRLSVHHTPDQIDELELYDLQHDPHEFINLAPDPSYSGLLTGLLTRMLRESSLTSTPWQPRIAFA